MGAGARHSQGGLSPQVASELTVPRVHPPRSGRPSSKTLTRYEEAVWDAEADAQDHLSLEES